MATHLGSLIIENDLKVRDILQLAKFTTPGQVLTITDADGTVDVIDAAALNRRKITLADNGQGTIEGDWNLQNPFITVGPMDLIVVTWSVDNTDHLFMGSDGTYGVGGSDTAIASDFYQLGSSAGGGNEFVDNVFRILDDGDNTKKIAFQAAPIAPGQTRTITMPDFDVDLGDLPQPPLFGVTDPLGAVNPRYTGDIYINTADLTSWTATGTGSNSWKRQDNIKVTLTGSDPAITDDNSLGYEPMSMWLNSLTDTLFICKDDSTGAAVWVPVGSSAGGGGIVYNINQVAHGLSVDDVIALPTTTYLLANSTDTTKVAVGIVTEVVDVDNFNFQDTGTHEWTVSVLVPGTAYYLGTTDGIVSDTEPSNNKQALFIALTSSTILINVHPMFVVTDVGDDFMLKSVYDINDNGIVDNSENLGGQSPAYYDQNTHVADTSIHFPINDAGPPAIDEVYSSDKTQTELDGKEDDLGFPMSDGQILDSTTGGVRSWVTLPEGEIVYTINQVAHGLILNDTIALAGTTYIKANSTDVTKVGVGVIVEIVDVDNFKYQDTGLTSYTKQVLIPGETYWLSTVDGDLIDVRPDNNLQSIGVATKVDELLLNIEYMVVYGAGAGVVSGVEEAPIDGTAYSRQDAGWISVGSGSGDMILASAQTVTGIKTFNDNTLVLRNVANTFNGVFVNTNTADRTYTLQDGDGTLAFLSDIVAGSPTSLSLGTVTATTLGITSDGGVDDVILPEANTTQAGLLGAAKWDEIVANTLKVTNATTNLSYIAAPTNGTVTSSDGNNATLTLSTAINAGLLAPGDFITLSNQSGVNTGDQTTIIGIVGTQAQFDVALTDGDFMYVGDAPTAHTHLLSAGATDVTATVDELNLLDLAGLTVGWVLSADSTTTASWKAATGGGDMLLSAIQTITGTKTFLDTTLLLRNVANTFNGSFINTNTADRVYTLQDGSGTLAFLSDITGGGDVVGPASATDTAIARYNLTTGKLIQDSLILIDNSGNLSGIGNITLSGTVDGIDIGVDVAANTAKITNVTTDLGYIASPTNGIVTSSDGSDATLTLATAVNAGLLAPADLTLLDNTSGINSGDDAVNSLYSSLISNIATSLSTGTRTATTYGITSDGGSDDVILLEATTLLSGLLGADKWNEIVANTLKVSNASHTGDVAGDTVLTIQVNAVDIAMLSATGTPDNTNFLRGDNVWAVPGGSGDMVLASVQTVTGAKTFLTATLLLRNVADTFDGSFVNTNTADRIYTLQDAAGTLAFLSDITGINSGTNTGDQTSIVGITGTQAQFDAALTDGDFLYVGDVTSNISTELSIGTVTATTFGITSDGSVDDVILPEATTTVAGLLGADKWDEITANTLKVSNVTHTGDVAGDTALTIQPDAVDLSMLSATGVPSVSNFLRGDNTWATPAGSGDMVLADIQTVTGAKTFNTGTLLLNDTDSLFELILASTSTITAANKTLTLDVDDANRTLTISADASVAGINTGDQTSITGITGTKVEFNVAVTDGDFLYVGDVISNISTSLSTGTVTATTFGITSDGGVDDIILPEANTTQAGLLGADKWDEIALNTLKISNVTHTGEVTGSGALILHVTAISNQTLVTAGTGDMILVEDATDGLLKRVNASDFLGGSGDMLLAGIQTITGAKTFLDTTLLLRNVANTFDGSFVNTNTANRIYILQDAPGTVAFLSDITGINSGTNTGDQTITLTGDVTGTGEGSFATTISVDAVDIPMLSATGTPGATTFLRGDNTWATPAGSGDMVLADAQTVTGAKTFENGTLLLRNVADTFNGTFTHTNTVDRTYTLQDAAGTLAFISDIPGTIVTGVGAGAGMTDSGTATNPILDIISHAGTASTVGTLTITADSVGVNLGTSNITAAPGNHTHLLAVGATDITALASEVNLLDLSGLTAGWVLSADTATTASWKAQVSGGQVDSVVPGDGIDIDSADPINPVVSGQGLKYINETSGLGWRLVAYPDANYGNVGLRAVDFSYSAGGSSTRGATGEGSFASGIEPTASGKGSFASGNTTVADGWYSTTFGFHTSASENQAFAIGASTSASGFAALSSGNSTIASGDNSAAFGFGTQASNTEMIALGKYNADDDIASMLEVGIGTSGIAKATAFKVLIGGEVVAPDLTTALISGYATNRVLITREYGDANYLGGSGDMLLGTAQTVTAAKTFENTTLLLRNVADTFNGSFVNTNTVDRVYTLQDSAGTLAFLSDITGDVSKVGTPVDNQIGVWTGDGTIEGTTKFLYNDTTQLMTLGDGTISPELRLDKKGGTGTATINFYNDNTAAAGSIKLNSLDRIEIDTSSSGKLFISGTEYYQWATTYLGSSDISGGRVAYSGSSLTVPYVRRGSDPDSGIGGDGLNTVALISNDKTALLTSDAGTVTNVELHGSVADFGGTVSGEGVLRLNDVTTIPTGILGSGGLLYITGTQLHFLDDAGQDTDLTAAAGAGDMLLAGVQTITGAKTFEDAKLLLRNVADTFSSVFTNVNTAARTYTLQDGDGTLAFLSDISGGGDVSKVGTPVDGQIGVWTGDGTIEGTAEYTYDTTTQLMTIGDGTVSPEIRIDKEGAGTSTFHFYSDGLESSYIRSNNFEQLIINTATNQIGFYHGGSPKFYVHNSQFTSASSDGGAIKQDTTSLTVPYVYRTNDSNSGMGGDGSDNTAIISNAKTALLTSDAGTATNIELFGSSADFGGTISGEGVLRLNDVTTIPIGILASGGLLYVTGTELHYLDDAGLDTNLIAAGGTGDMVLADVQTVTGAKTFENGTLLLRNVADTFNGVFSNTNTADHTYTLQDADGTLAFTSDIPGTIVTSVGAGAGMTDSGTGVAPILDVISHAGTANSVGTITVTVDSVGVNLGTSNITAAAGDHIHDIFDRVTSVLSNAAVFSDIIVTDGITTGISTRNITLADIGYTGAVDADNYASWTAAAEVVGNSITSGDTLRFTGGTGITIAWLDQTAPSYEMSITNSAPNATHTGEVTGSGVLTMDPTAISNRTLVVAAIGDMILVEDATDGLLKRVNASDFLGGSGDMILASVQTITGAKTFNDTTLLLRNVADTFNGSFINTNTADRVYTLQNAAGTLAFISDITGINSGTNTGDQTSIVGITGTMAEFDVALTDGDFMYIGDAPTAHTHLLAAGATDVTATAVELNILDLTATALTAGWGYFADGVSTASWRQLLGSEISNTEGWNSGNVTKVGTPVNNQLGVWTGDGTIEGDVALTFDSTTHSLRIGDATQNVELDLDYNTATAGILRFLEEGALQNYITSSAGAISMVHGSTSVNLGADVTISTILKSVVTTGYQLSLTSSLTSPLYTKRDDTNTGVGFNAADGMSLISGGNIGIAVISASVTANIELFGASEEYGATTSGRGVLKLNDVSQIPVGTMTQGGLLYVTGTELHYLSDTGVDTNLVAAGGTPTYTKGITIETPVAADNITMFFTDVAITLTQLNDVIQGTTSITWNISHATTRNGTPNDIFSADRVTSSAAGAETTTFNDATIPAGSWIWYNASALSGTPTELNITLTYTID